VADAFRGALAMAGLSPTDVGWVHAHGTATPTNDAVEAAAVRALFGDRPVPVSSTKHLFGHTLGAAGAVSAVVAAIALRERFLPANARVERPDPACAVNLVTQSSAEPPPGHVLVSSLGFGGASCALAVSKVRT
jgi:3-oxoacyl-[acyl-carrier-protein] synthase-1